MVCSYNLQASLPQSRFYLHQGTALKKYSITMNTKKLGLATQP